MKSKQVVLGLILGLASFSTSCGSKHKKKQSSAIVTPLPKVTKYFTHGDPLEMIEGTKADKSGLVTPENFESFNDFQLTGAVNFSHAIAVNKVKPITSQKDLEDENNTSEEEAPFVSRYFFKQEGNNYIYKDDRPEAEKWPEMTFSIENGKLVLKEFSGKKVQGLHYSVKDGGQAFSILIQSKDESGISLTGLYFIKTKTTTAAIRKVVSEANYYVQGDGIAIPWKRDIHIDLCGRNADLYKYHVDSAMADWSKAGSFESNHIGSLGYTVAVKADPRPFTDLNQNCVNFVPRYRMEDQENTRVYGITLPLIDRFTQEIVQSQIFIFTRAVSDQQQVLQPIITHEVGHALGLGHKFGGFKLNPSMSSIMAYDGTSSITDADKATIKNLYPASPDAAEEIIKGF
jgi:hypothetical protein